MTFECPNPFYPCMGFQELCLRATPLLRYLVSEYPRGVSPSVAAKCGKDLYLTGFVINGWFWIAWHITVDCFDLYGVVLVTLLLSSKFRCLWDCSFGWAVRSSTAFFLLRIVCQLREFSILRLQIIRPSACLVCRTICDGSFCFISFVSGILRGEYLQGVWLSMAAVCCSPLSPIIDL